MTTTRAWPYLSLHTRVRTAWGVLWGRPTAYRLTVNGARIGPAVPDKGLSIIGCRFLTPMVIEPPT